MLKHLIVVAIVSGFCAAMAIACFWWASPETRRVATIVAGVGSAAALELVRQQARTADAGIPEPHHPAG